MAAAEVTEKIADATGKIEADLAQYSNYINFNTLILHVLEVYFDCSVV